MESVSYRLEDLKSGTIKVRTHSATPDPTLLTIFNRFIGFRNRKHDMIDGREIIFSNELIVEFAIVLL